MPFSYPSAARIHPEEAAVLSADYARFSNPAETTSLDCPHNYNATEKPGYFAGKVAALAYIIGEIDRSAQADALSDKDVVPNPFIGVLSKTGVSHILLLTHVNTMKKSKPFDQGMEDMACKIRDTLHLR